MDIDAQGRAHLRTKPSMEPCEECGVPGPNKEWQVLGATGVLCTRCLSKWIAEVNAQLGAKETAPTSDYVPQSGDIYLQQLRPGQWNLHCYIDGVWVYQCLLVGSEAERYVALMRKIGETKEPPMGLRRYYRPRQA